MDSVLTFLGENLFKLLTAVLGLAGVWVSILNRLRTGQMEKLEDEIDHLKKINHRITSRVDPESDRQLIIKAKKSMIPDVVGLRETWAFNLLESAGFVVVRDTAEAPDVRGTVVALDPEAGTELALPGQIIVTVSLGPPLVAMPRVLGMVEAEARDTLEALGLTVLEVQEVFRFGRSRGIVVEQAPPADSLLEVGSAVRFSVGRGRGREELEERNKKPLQP